MFVNPLLSEELFQHIWRLRLFAREQLQTTAGEPLQVLHPGTLNRNGGPDFTAATIRIGDAVWVGNVELHLCTSHWFRHGHQHNRQYQNIILHVVFLHDMPGATTAGVPCLELQQHIPKLLLQRYELLRRSAAFVPCAASIGQVPRLTWISWMDRLLAERWEQRVAVLRTWLHSSRYDWEEVCYWAVAESFGRPVNTLPLLQVAQSLPARVLLRHRQQPLAVEALVFGQAGMLSPSFRDVYPLQLQDTYRWLQHKYQLQPLAPHQWNWLRMRPAAFPTIRLAAFAALLQNRQHLFSKLLEAASIAELEQLFAVQPQDYWRTHYRFDHAVSRTQWPAKQAVHSILINAVLPLMFLYGQEKQSAYYRQKALDLLQQLPPERNRITRQWAQLGIPQENALASQALLQLKQYYCEERRCLLCAVGNKILSN
ncbi:DUF2851 family protein [Chitinophaga vietnamensis]|uniref:DUF2851 family protein n=1 Tax=Chitinophaga vietnamensis TaxID=2593957 RepID=UPI0011788A46|nr:DUF2851 family protein [Chitinophaga vietnamensis]